jgi:hypothetical protein
MSIYVLEAQMLFSRPRPLVLVIAVLVVGIASVSLAQETKSAPPTPIDEQKAELGGTPWNPQWDQIIEKALPAEMLSFQVSQDVRPYCPHFYQMNETDKRAFWAYFFQALAGVEAGLNPNSTIRHGDPGVANRDEVTGMTIRSEGLLQLAYADQKRYGCDFNWQADRSLKVTDPAKTILQPKNNLECGVKILYNQLIVQHKPLLSSSAYWSPLQPNSPGHLAFAKQMTNPPAGCALPVKSKINKSATTQSVNDDAKQAETQKR